MKKIAIFFGPLDGAVHKVAAKIEQLIGTDHVALVPVKDARAADLEGYDKIIFGISTVGKETWDAAYNNADWARFLPEISKARYEGKTIAIYGLGDHITYAATFVDHMGVLAKELVKSMPTLLSERLSPTLTKNTVPAPNGSLRGLGEAQWAGLSVFMLG